MNNSPIVRLAALLVLVGLSGCTSPGGSESVQPTRIAAPPLSATSDALVTIFNRELPQFSFSRTNVAATVDGIDYVEKGEAEISLVPSDVSYIAYTNGTGSHPNPHKRIRGVAMLHIIGMHLFVPADAQFRTVRDLRGKKIGIGERGTNTNFTLRTILPFFGVPLSQVEFEQSPFVDAFGLLSERSIDALFLMTSFPFPDVRTQLPMSGAKLVSIEGPDVEGLSEHYPFLRPVTIPAGTYEGQTQDIQTIGSQWLLVCRDDLDGDLLYQMLSVFFDSLGELAEIQPALRTVTLDQAPAAPIPLHPGAARFYRERRLFR